MPEHAVCSPSAAHRWMHCTPSARLEQKYPDTTSESASEGTFAHAWAELQLRLFLNQITQDDYVKRRKEMIDNEFYSKALKDYTEEYVDIVISKYNAAKARDKGAALLLEQHVDFTEWVPEGYGRSDAIVLADGLMEVIDFKYGRNVQVVAQNNPQLRLYALGAYAELACIYDIDTTVLTIVQPRNGGESSETLRHENLLAWGDSIKPVAKLAYEGKGKVKPGDYCRFCKAASKCRELAEYQMSITEHMPQQTKELTDEEIADILQRADGFISWLNGVKDYALAEACDHGHKWPGMKLVEGRSCQKYTDETEVAYMLNHEGYDDDLIYKPESLIGITAMEKLLGPKKFKSLMSEYLIKPPGKPTLVPDSDKRPEWNSPENDFEDIPDSK